MRVQDFLRQATLFEGLDDAEIDRLAACCAELTLPAHRAIFDEGDAADAFYLICSGRVAIFRNTLGRPLQLLAHLEPGEFFGELGLLHDAPRTASARTAERSRLLRLGRADLLALLERHAEIALRLQNAAIRRHTANVTSALALTQRRELRIRLSHKVELDLEEGRTLAATLENLSPGGLSLGLAAAAWLPGMRVRFALRCAGLRFEVRGRISWRDGDRVGVAFTTTAADHETQIQGLLRRLLELSV